MKWILCGVFLFITPPVLGQSETGESLTVKSGTPTREQRLEMLRERQAEAQKGDRPARGNASGPLGSNQGTLSREEIKRNQDARSALRTGARRDKRLRKVRGLKKRLEGVKQTQKRSLHSHQWRLARIHVALEI